MNAEGALQQQRCSVCGELALDAGDDGRAIVHAGLDESSVVCHACSSRLSAEIAEGHTAIVGEEPAPDSVSARAAPLLDEGGSSRQIVLADPAPVKALVKRDDLLASRLDSQPLDVEGAEFEFARKRSFGNYELLGEISRGSFGVVYKARQAGLDRIVALKVLLDGSHASKETVERFHREAKSVARLKHPNVVPIYDIGTWDGHHYFAMEFIEGHPLSSHILARDLAISTALRIAEQVADALECAHKAGIIHRDIKPSNILLDRHGKPHITDFGLAKQVDIDNKYTMSGTTLGTPAYMPPEQARGQLEKIDARSDVYALGTVLYEMLTGVTPFTGRSLLEVVVAVINEPVPPPRHLNPKIHRDVQTIVLKCLEKEPKNRYASAADLRDDLRRFRSGEAILAKPAGIFSRLGRFVVRRGWYLATAAAVLIVAGILAYTFQKGAQQAKRIDDLEKEKNEIVKTQKVKALPTWKTEWEFSGSKSLEPGTATAYWLYGPGSAPETRAMPPQETQVTPEAKRFFGDFRARFEFTLTPEAAAQGFNVGLQTISSIDGIPYCAEYGNGTVRIIGPVDLYEFVAKHAGDPKIMPVLEVKIQKEIPPLVAANYTLNIERNDMRLKFTLSGETAPTALSGAGEKWGPVSAELRDKNISNWTQKDVQLVVRHKPGGMMVNHIEVERKLGGYSAAEYAGLTNFISGDYMRAEAEFNLLVKDDDGFTRARAKFFLGLIKEICLTPPTTIDAVWPLYGDAELEMDHLPPETDPEVIREHRRLLHELHLRLVVCYSKMTSWPPQKRWQAIVDELNKGWMNGEKINESIGWELQGVLKDINNQPLMLPQVGDGIADAVLRVFAHSGLSPASDRFSESARDFARILVLKNRFRDLRELYKSVPSVKLYPAFADAAGAALKATPPQLDEALTLLTFLPEDAGRKTPALAQRAADCVVGLAKAQRFNDALTLLLRYNVARGFVALCNELGPAALDPPPSDNFYAGVIAKIATVIPPDDAARRAFEDAAERIGRGLIERGRDAELIPLHNALRLGARQDQRLSGLFVESIGRLASSAEAADEELALKLLRHAYNHVARTGSGIRAAAADLAEKKSVTEDEEAYKRLLSEIKQACPSADLQKYVRNLFDAMNATERYDDAITYFMRSRSVFTNEGPALLPQIVVALKNTPPDNRLTALETLSSNVSEELKKRDDDYALRQWTLDEGDIRLALGYWDSAVKNYRSLLGSSDDDPSVAARAALRLRAIGMAQPELNAAGIDSALNAPGAPDDVRFAGELLAPGSKLTPEVLDKKLKQIHVPVLAEADWLLIKGLRRRADGKDGEAQSLFKQAAEHAQGTSPWTGAVAGALAQTQPKSE